jgi:UPF0755 protein
VLKPINIYFMRRKILTFLSVLTLSSMGGVLLFWGPGGILSQGPHSEDVTVIIEKGSTLSVTAHLLAQKGTLLYPWSFVTSVLLSGNRGALKAGEYLIPAHASPLDIVRMLVSGKIVTHQVTIPEGMTVAQIIDIIKVLPHLVGEVACIPEEGTLLPETYRYAHGDSREKVMAQMRRSMKLALEEVWKKKKKELPIKTPEELLVLASIVEKETGVPTERSQVAAVFLNRLKKGMKLQSDPTVIYGITLGGKPLGRLLTLNDLKHESAYNTYLIPALPPKPIACPGRKSLEAIVEPAITGDYYFVANGTGGHTFSPTYSQHLENVREWRKVQKKE